MDDDEELNLNIRIHVSPIYQQVCICIYLHTLTDECACVTLLTVIELVDAEDGKEEHGRTRLILSRSESHTSECVVIKVLCVYRLQPIVLAEVSWWAHLRLFIRLKVECVGWLTDWQTKHCPVAPSSIICPAVCCFLGQQQQQLTSSTSPKSLFGLTAASCHAPLESNKDQAPN